ncbi:hypothetical protein BKA93DRAFT_825347 [Sparassis latifolia]
MPSFVVDRPKRPSKDPPSPERDVKRPKHHDLRLENQLAYTNPSSTPSPLQPPTDNSKPHRRSQSAPVHTNFPHLDLTKVPPSPSKATVPLRIASLPPVDVTNAERQSTNPFTLSPPTPPVFHIQAATPRASRTKPLTLPPLSPLTPLPSAPLPPTHQQHSSDTSVPACPVSIPRLVHSRATHNPSVHPAFVVPPPTPSTSASRLPRPSAVSSTHLIFTKGEDHTQRDKPIQKIKGRLPKRTATVTQFPLGGRMTRSASLRQAQNRRNEDDVPVKPGTSANLPSTSAAPASSLSSGLSRKRSLSFSFARPTSSSAAKSQPSSPTKPRSDAPPRTPRGTAEQRFSSSSLSNLSVALMKLSMPAPSRPSTSMGFDSEPMNSGDNDHTQNVRPVTLGDKSVRAHADIKDPVLVEPQLPTVPLNKAATHGNLSTPCTSSRASNLEIPTANSSIARTQKRINVHSGIIAGRPRNMIAVRRIQAGSDKNRPRFFGVGTLSGPAVAGRSRVTQKASQKTTLPSVQGSPVKGSGIMEVESCSSPSEILQAASNVDGIVVPAVDGSEGADDGNLAQDIWKSTSRRASLASHFLSQSLSSLPQTPPFSSTPDETTILATLPGSRRSTLRSMGGSRALVPTGAHTAPGKFSQAAGKGAHVSARKDGESPATSITTEMVEPSGSWSVLKECVIFVDVRTDDGDDAGALFIDMLRGMGARILTRVGQSCTHVVYKNGLMSTLTRYRLLNEPKPLVVGIAWVVECVENRARADETRFLVDLDGLNVAGTNKRRRSMLPKQFHFAAPTHVPTHSGSVEADGTVVLNAVQAMAADSPSSDVADDLSGVSSPGNETLAPLERARRRRSMLIGLPTQS